MGGSKINNEGERFKARLTAKLADGKVTTKEADAIIRDAKDGHFDEVDAHYLAGFVDHKKDAFDAEARKKLVDFVSVDMKHLATIQGDEGRKRPVHNPALTKEDRESGKVTMAAREGKLTVNGFGADDAMQGQVGDCYLISSLAAVAKSHPELLARAVKTNSDGTYTVTFHERRPGETKSHLVPVTVDGSFAMRHGELEYAAARETKELWPMIFEKAYAAWKGGFDAIEGGMAATTLEALTGAKADFFPVTSESDPKETFQRLKDALANGGCVVALSKPWEPGRQGVIADHAYTVLDVKEERGQQLVQLRNPWGEQEPGHDGRDDGIFWLPMKDFLSSYATVEHARPG